MGITTLRRPLLTDSVKRTLDMEVNTEVIITISQNIIDEGKRRSTIHNMGSSTTAEIILLLSTSRRGSILRPYLLTITTFAVLANIAAKLNIIQIFIKNRFL